MCVLHHCIGARSRSVTKFCVTGIKSTIGEVVSTVLKGFDMAVMADMANMADMTDTADMADMTDVVDFADMADMEWAI